MNPLTVAAFVAAAAVGGLIRWQAARLDREGMPLGTLAVNVLAAFVAGLLTDVSATVAVIATTAHLGSTSTFSTVTAELVDLRMTHGLARSITYAAVTCIAGIAAAAVGLSL